MKNAIMPALLLSLCVYAHAALNDPPEARPIPAPDDESGSTLPDYLKPLLPGNFDKAAWTGRINLHLHSRKSDGTLTPTQVVEQEYAAGVRELALTDHDSVDGVREAWAAARRLGMTFHPGLEISAGTGVHLLALDVAIDNAALVKIMAENRAWRLERAKALIAEIDARPEVKAKGVRVTLAQVLAKADGAPIGRPHIAEVLVDLGLVRSADAAFDSYLKSDDGGDADADAPEASADAVISAVHGAGGKVFFAHPYTAAPDVAQGLFAEVDGIEGYRPSHARSPEGIAQQNQRALEYLEAARKRGLPVSCGSDFHSPDGRMNHQTVWMPKVLAQQLREALRASNRGALEHLGQKPDPPARLFSLPAFLEKLRAAVRALP